MLQKEEEEGEEKYEENKTNFEGTCLRKRGFSSNLELEVPHPEGTHTANFVCFCSGSVELQMREDGIFFTPVKYTLVCRAPQVSWAARHTTVCLDFKRVPCSGTMIFSGALQSNTH